MLDHFFVALWVYDQRLFMFMFLHLNGCHIFCVFLSVAHNAGWSHSYWSQLHHLYYGQCLRWSYCMCFLFIQRLPNGPSSILDDGEIDRQRESEIERQRAELGQLKERLALMCRQVPDSETLLLCNAFISTNKLSQAGNVNRQKMMRSHSAVCLTLSLPVRLGRSRSSWRLPGGSWPDPKRPTRNYREMWKRWDSPSWWQNKPPLCVSVTESISLTPTEICNSLLWYQSSHLPTWQQHLLLYTWEPLPCSHGDSVSGRATGVFTWTRPRKPKCGYVVDRKGGIFLQEGVKSPRKHFSLSLLLPLLTCCCFIFPLSFPCCPSVSHRLVNLQKWALLKSVKNKY